MRLTDSKNDSFRRLAKNLPNYSRKEQDIILEKAKANEYYLNSSDEKYFELLSKYPRGEFCTESLDYKKIERMSEEYYGASESKEQLLTVVAKNQLSGREDGIVIGLIGNPGTGKTNFARFAARLLGRPYVAISMANMTDPSEISGVKDKKIGKIAQGFIDAGSEMPLFLFDELEKASMEVQNTLLTYLDPLQNRDLVDEYLGISIPIQKAVIIATVNDADHLSYPVFDRLDKIWMVDYTPTDKVEISKRGAIKEYTLAAGLRENSVIFSDKILTHIANRYGLGAGYRRMEKMLQRIIGGCAREILSKGLDKGVYEKAITTDDVFEYLGESIVRERKIAATHRIGVVNGLAVGSLGGDVLPIEASVYPGNGEYDLTGSLGEVMRESAKVAKASVRRLLAEECNSIDINRIGIHIHAPDGAQRKEGASAGVAIAVALYSAITKQKLNREFAISGEINLQGEILAVGGLESKLTAAFKSGISTVILSEENREDMEQIVNPDIDKTRIRYISTLREALDLMLICELETSRTAR